MPRGKMSEDPDWMTERNTLPRGKSESDTGWGRTHHRRSLSRDKSESDWGERRVRGKTDSEEEDDEDEEEEEEEEWCPACTSSRVSFQSVKDSGGSLSLPTPPPPPSSNKEINIKVNEVNFRSSGLIAMNIQFLALAKGQKSSYQFCLVGTISTFLLIIDI